jgi:YVTN family beta-propeller protein
MAVKLDTRRNRLYASTGRGGKIVVLDVSGTPRQVGEVKVGTRPWGFALTGDGKFLYTANGPSNDVSVVDTATLKVIKTIKVGSSPWGVAVSR